MTALDFYKDWRLTSGFGWRDCPMRCGKSSSCRVCRGTGRNFHNGIDLGTPNKTNDPVPTPRAGAISHIGYNAGRGNYAVQRTGGILLIFQHLHSYKCRVGDYLKIKDIVGLAGRTGDATGIHLHFELRADDGTALGGEVINPENFNLSPEIFDPGQWIITTADPPLNLRSGPSTSYPRVKQLLPETQGIIQYHEENGVWANGHTWWHLKVGDKLGWVASDWLKKVDPPFEELQRQIVELEQELKGALKYKEVIKSVQPLLAEAMQRMDV